MNEYGLTVSTVVAFYSTYKCFLAGSVARFLSQ